MTLFSQDTSDEDTIDEETDDLLPPKAKMYKSQQQIITELREEIKVLQDSKQASNPLLALMHYNYIASYTLNKSNQQIEMSPKVFHSQVST